MPVMFMLLQKWTFDGKFQICKISLLPTNSVFLITPYSNEVLIVRYKTETLIDTNLFKTETKISRVRSEI
jgi:hypothetical protein